MTNPRKDPSRRCLKVHEWPQADRAAWEEAGRQVDLLNGDAGPASRWSPDTAHKNRKGYGRWIRFLQTKGWLDPDTLPVSRITPDRVAAYLEELVQQVAPWTVRNRIAELLAVACAIAPDSDWSWLKNVLARHDARTRDARPKLARMRSAAEIWAWAYATMEQIDRRTPAKTKDAIRFRDALMIALLIVCPILRRRNLAAICVGRHLRRTSTGYELVFEAFETKTRRQIEAPVPEELTAFLDRYLELYRSLLLKGNEADRLWISMVGAPMSAMSLYHRIVRVTSQAFGAPINPHLFRDCAVTTVAVEDPEHIAIAPHILGHDRSTTTERHYLQAQALVASRRLRETIARLRRTLPSPRPIVRRRAGRGSRSCLS